MQGVKFTHPMPQLFGRLMTCKMANLRSGAMVSSLYQSIQRIKGLNMDKNEILYGIVCVIVFACIGVMLAWRG
jgi:hypothetical protein